MLSKEKKINTLEKTVASNTFKNAPTSIAILRYLVQANIENRPLKESIIDLEFFGGSPDDGKSNPRVRVNVYNLRKKLENYYQNEGASDAWQMVIEKGQYSVRFEEPIKNDRKKPDLKTKQVIPYLLFFLAILILILTNIPKRKPEMWKDFFNNQHTNYLFIGDAFGYGGKTVSGLPGWTRDFSINSLDEYYALLEEQPELKATTSPTDFFYSTRMAENATHSLSQFFTTWNNDFEIKYATRTSFSDIKKGNTIYVGRLKDQTNFVYLFNEANNYFKIEDEIIKFSGHETIADTSFLTVNNSTETDYTVVSRIPGPDDTEQFLFFSNHDIGVMATTEYFTNKDSIKAFSQRHLKNSPYFTALYKVKGKERINLTLEAICIVPLE